jgi:uncharacterized protein YdeI (BOF family)
MKNILILCVTVLVGGVAYATWHYTRPEHYGNAFVGAAEVSLRELALKSAVREARDVRIQGEIVRQCPATGCWFYLDDGKGNRIKVELGKVVPQLPQRLGSRAVVEGRVVEMGDEAVFAGNGVEFK